MEKELVNNQHHCSDPYDRQSPANKGVHLCAPFLFKEKKDGRDGLPAHPLYQRAIRPILPLPHPMPGPKDVI